MKEITQRPQYHFESFAFTAPLERASRGRNNVFTARSVQLYARPAFEEEPALVQVEAFSGRTGSTAPLILSLSPEDAILLADALRVAARTTLPADLQQELALHGESNLATP